QAPAAEVAPAEPPAAQDEAAQLEAMLQELGAPPDMRALFTAMAQEDADPMMLMMLMGMAGGPGGGGDGDAIGFAMLMRALGSQGKQPTAVANGDKLLVIEDGVVYRIDLNKMAVDGQVAYRPKKSAVAGLVKLLPLIAGAARPKAEQAACLSNAKQIGLGIMMYAQDHDQTLPTEDWVEELMPYIKNEQLLRCPAAGDAMPAYGFNEKLLGLTLADIAKPAETVLVFEKDPADGTNVGGPEQLAARHEGSVVIGFADGHVQVMPLDQVMRLRWDP
ncbi:MAG TPA: hypothetical protein PLQ54_05395, partial [Armatimonadota bacterium]|nr:hypothetical protein [Armatimonadota bacterium]